MFPVGRCWPCIGLLVLVLDPLSRQALAGDTQPLPRPDAAPVAVQQVQLDVVVARVKRGLAGKLAFHDLKRSGQTQLFTGILESPRAEDFLAFLQALKDEDLARVLAAPRLMTLSGNPASFRSGGDLPVPVPLGHGQVGVQFEEFGTRLNFLPTVLGNGAVRLEVEPEVSTLTGAGVRNTQRIHTAMELKAGQALLIGGMRSQEKGELVVLVTPTVVNAGPGRQPDKQASAPLRRLERRLKRLEEEVDNLHRQLRSLPPSDPEASRP
jgi:Flp pilus assembly secretin CpaC